ncbi:hypothetical protein B0H10DRAFT_1234407 [Mycena sp. CBHHK59/15]|nr:hypothetical protein B0H10DRAFT_1234407 [Mycena sp. CBHHK59/15]
MVGSFGGCVDSWMNLILCCAVRSAIAEAPSRERSNLNQTNLVVGVCVTKFNILFPSRYPAARHSDSTPRPSAFLPLFLTIVRN